MFAPPEVFDMGLSSDRPPIRIPLPVRTEQWAILHTRTACSGDLDPPGGIHEIRSTSFRPRPLLNRPRLSQSRPLRPIRPDPGAAKPVETIRLLVSPAGASSSSAARTLAMYLGIERLWRNPTHWQLLHLVIRCRIPKVSDWDHCPSGAQAVILSRGKQELSRKIGANRVSQRYLSITCRPARLAGPGRGSTTLG